MLSNFLKQLNFFFLVRFTFLVEYVVSLLRRSLCYVVFMSDFYLVFWFSAALWIAFFNTNSVYFWDTIFFLNMVVSYNFTYLSFFLLMVGDAAAFITNFLSLILFSIKNICYSLNLLQYSALIINPLRDIDLTVNTDFEDLLAFLGDTLEFVEQDRAFFFDAIFDFYSVSGELITFLSLELMVIKNIKKLPQSVTLAKFFQV